MGGMRRKIGGLSSDLWGWVMGSIRRSGIGVWFLGGVGLRRKRGRGWQQGYIHKGRV